MMQSNKYYLREFRNSIKQTNWYVNTGGSGSGKTTTVDVLNARGYKTAIEYASHYFDTNLIQSAILKKQLRRLEKIRQYFSLVF
jgi:predicted ATPase